MEVFKIKLKKQPLKDRWFKCYGREYKIISQNKNTMSIAYVDEGKWERFEHSKSMFSVNMGDSSFSWIDPPDNLPEEQS